MKIVPQKVDYVDKMGSDLSVVNAARVSFNKVSTLFDRADGKLIKYLAVHNHWTPFGHTSLSLRIKCPIFVARQLGKHQVGLVWNEVSRRYVDDEPEFFMPDVWRSRAKNVKQGSSDQPITEYVFHEFGKGKKYAYGVDTTADDAVRSSIEYMYNLYDALLVAGVAPEQARMVLPQNTMTEFIWTGSIAAFARIAKLRLDPHTQLETQEIAKDISTICLEHFPVSWEALVGDLSTAKPI